ncbi:MAG: NADH-quinone oxidoreductase subunit A [Thermonemataceae bacterium]|nr:NADH-quinone oxidoreductase subunit A [Thermonemataceae bacterium]
MVSEFGKILLFVIGAVAFVMTALGLSYLIRPKKPNPEKLSSYECGEEAIGSPWQFFNIRFYVVAIIFILFEVEIVFLFPWSVVLDYQDLQESTKGAWAWWALGEMFVFIFILALGLAYVWVKGYLDWIKPAVRTEPFKEIVPRELYDNINKKYS